MYAFDKEVLTRFMQGDEASFKVIYNFFYPRIYHFIREYMPNNDLAKDIVQDTFFTLWNKRYELKEDTNINAWLYTVARNNCLKELRDNKFQNVLLLSDVYNELELKMNEEALSSLDVSDVTLSEIEHIVEQTLAGLTPQCRKIFEYSRYKNLKNKDVAEELNITVKAVEAQITKALKILRVSLKDYLPLVSFLFFTNRIH